MLIFIAFVLLSLSLFYTSIYYCFCLVLLVTLSLSYLIINMAVSSLIVVVMLIVYAGAVIILIGYVSAVSPNYVSAVSPNYVVLLYSFLLFTFFVSFYFYDRLLPLNSSFTLLEVFYTPLGISFLLVLLFRLFMTLLIVTSQYLCPVGPFRSAT